MIMPSPIVACRRLALAIALVAPAAVLTGPAAPASARQQAARVAGIDLADRVTGVWHGAVTSDVRGSSRTGVNVTVTKVGRSVVEVSCDYARIPTVRIPLTRPASSIVNASGPSTFLVELERDPNRLDLYIDGASLILRR